jgi:small nuclear ribonucleoprotein (snRNP)-like protein
MTEQQNKKRVTVRLADGSTVKGNINIKKHTRLTDLLNSSDEASFIVMTDAAISGHPGKTVIVCKDQIVWVSPDD